MASEMITIVAIGDTLHVFPAGDERADKIYRESWDGSVPAAINTIPGDRLVILSELIRNEGAPLEVEDHRLPPETN